MSLPPPFSPQLIVNENCFLHIPIKLIQNKKKHKMLYFKFLCFSFFNKCDLTFFFSYNLELWEFDQSLNISNSFKSNGLNSLFALIFLNSN